MLWKPSIITGSILSILLTKTTATQNETALNYHKLRALYFLAVVFVRSIFHVHD